MSHNFEQDLRQTEECAMDPNSFALHFGLCWPRIFKVCSQKWNLRAPFNGAG